MKKSFLAAALVCAMLSACVSSDKTGDATASADRMNAWSDADITNLSDTRYAEQFKNTVNPIIYFGFNSSSLNGTALTILNEQLAWLHQNPNAMIVIEGHCDERGTREYNLALGERRANAVRDYFVANGINAGRIRIISYGKERPDVFGSTEAAWSKNRRTVTIVN